MEYGARDQLQGYGTTRFAYDGARIGSEWNWTPSLATLLSRYVPGPGVDETVVWYEGSGTADRRWLHADERGSVIALSDGAGAMLSINRYDEYGIPQSSNAGRFGYTGQAWLAELGMWYYKARIYSPTLGRFLQTDPIGYEDGMNLYAYVGSDPVNWVDPTGLAAIDDEGFADITVVGPELPDPIPDQGTTILRLSMSIGTPTGRNAKTSLPAAPQKEKPEESTVDKAMRCASAQFGLDDLAAAGAAFSGFNILETRGKFAGATPGTSIASRGASAVFGQTRLPFRLPTIVGNPLTLSARIRATGSVARIVGRGIPVVGWGLLAYDAAKIAQCVASDD